MYNKHGKIINGVLQLLKNTEDYYTKTWKFISQGSKFLKDENYIILTNLQELFASLLHFQ